MTLFAALSAGTKTYLRWYLSIYLFSTFTEQLGGCLFKCWCIVKFSNLMSTIRKNSFFQSLRACTPTPSFLHHRLQYVWSASSTILRHSEKSILDGSLYLGPFLKSDRSHSRGSNPHSARIFIFLSIRSFHLFTCFTLLADIFLYSYEAEFIQSLLSTWRKQLASRFNFTYRYIDDVLSINNPEFENYLSQMYPVELEIKETTESNTSASYLDLLLSIGRDGQLHTSIYDNRDDFNFHITKFPFLSSNIPTSPAYGVFISQLIRYARACSSYGSFILKVTRLSNKLLEQWYVKERLKSSLRKFYGRYGDLIKQYEVSLSQILNDILWPDHIQWQPRTDQTFYRILSGFQRTFATGLECRQGTLTPQNTWSVPLGLAYVLLVETNPFPNWSLFYRTPLFEYPSVLSRLYLFVFFFL